MENRRKNQFVDNNLHFSEEVESAVLISPCCSFFTLNKILILETRYLGVPFSLFPFDSSTNPFS